MINRRSALGLLAGGVSTAATLRWPLAAIGEREATILRHAAAAAKGFAGPLRILLPRGSEANVGPVAADFSKATGVETKFVFVDVDGVNAKILTDKLIGAQSFDVALPATFGIPDLVEADALAPLDEYEARYDLALRPGESLYPVGDSFLDKLYGYQTDGDVYVMFYRKSWLEDPAERKAYADKFGEPLRIAQSWDELDRQMAHFHRPDEGRYGGALFRNSTYLVWEWWIRAHANGVWPVDERFQPAFQSEGAVAALEALVAASDHLYPDSKANGLTDNWRSFAEGDIFCNIGWGGSQKYFNAATSKIRGDLVFGPTPGGGAGGRLKALPYFNWGWNYTVSSTAPNRELAYLFCRFAVTGGVSIDAIRHSDGFFDPFRPEHYQNEQILDAYGAPFLAAHKQSMTDSIPDFYVRGKGEYFNALTENIERALRGGISAKEAMELCAIQWNQITDRLGRDAQIAQWRSLKAKYPKAVRDYLDRA